MKKFMLIGLSVILMVGAVCVSRPMSADAADDQVRAGALKLFKSLTDEQKKLAVLEFNDKERFKEAFPAVKRLGVPYSMLNADQKALIVDVMKAMTSDYGAQRCLEVTKETPDGSRYL